MTMLTSGGCDCGPEHDDRCPAVQPYTDDLKATVKLGSVGYDVRGNRLVVQAMGQVDGELVVKVHADNAIEPRGSWVDVMYAGDLMPETREQTDARRERFPQTLLLWPPFEREHSRDCSSGTCGGGGVHCWGDEA